MSSLEAIRYARGNLELLDQLALPLETKYIDVRDCDACWRCIKDMNVRGAPAIAIAAALALAVELEAKRGTLTTCEAAEAFVRERFDHMYTSRPTAVNLGEAKNRIQALAKRLSESGDVSGMIEGVIGGCEAMHAEDVASCRAIGDKGAAALLRACGAKDGEKIKVMTCCNTGSLATAATVLRWG